MKIVFFIGGLSKGGAERVTCNLANHLVAKGHDITILTMSDDNPSYSLRGDVKREVLIKKTERKNRIYTEVVRFFRLCKHLRKDKCDAYVVMLPITTILFLSLRWLTKSKVIAAERVSPLIYSKSKQWPLKLLANKANGWVFQTLEEKDWYGTALGKSKVVVIPNAINPEFIKPAYQGERSCEIVTAGRLTSQKNHKLLVKAFASLHDKFPNYRLIIYGEGPLKDSLKEQVESFGLGDKVQFPGYTTNIGEKIKSASLFVLSSDFEGMPNALMEAMALGLPCISTDCEGGGAKFLVKDGINGLLTPKGDVDALANAIEKMLSDKEFSKTCGEEAHKICEQLAPERIYGEWESFIQNVVNN